MSSKAVKQPFATVEPKSAKALRNVEVASVRSLLLDRFVKLALEEVQTAFRGTWCFPRITEATSSMGAHASKQNTSDVPEDAPIHSSKRPRVAESNPTRSGIDDNGGNQSHTVDHFTAEPYYHNDKPMIKKLQVDSESSILHIPPQSSFLHGDIEHTRTIFNLTAPQFNLVTLDPPWPNRSARRKQSYNISANTLDIAALLSSIPLASHLAEDALVGIWVTNKPAIHDLVLGTNGLFDSWGLGLVEEWVWLKVTTSGEPICALDSTWRKPYEILLVGRKRGSGSADAGFKRRVIIGVPDLHSRKPNLKTLFEPMLPSRYEALEIFARNLTAGWWAWGYEVLKFQSEEHWVDSSNDT
jgi:N6-adenosine-specific RNA methylase IME4